MPVLNFLTQRYAYQDNMKKQDILKELKKWILRSYGKRCTDTSVGCPICDMWWHYDAVKHYMEV